MGPNSLRGGRLFLHASRASGAPPRSPWATGQCSGHSAQQRERKQALFPEIPSAFGSASARVSQSGGTCLSELGGSGPIIRKTSNHRCHSVMSRRRAQPLSWALQVSPSELGEQPPPTPLRPASRRRKAQEAEKPHMRILFRHWLWARIPQHATVPACMSFLPF